MEKIKINILPNLFLNPDGTFDKERAINLCGKIAGVCYDKEGFSHLEKEPLEKTNNRIKMTLNNGHHSVYDHISISFNCQNIPKILAMILNNEHQYTTSEKSARYTPIQRNSDSVITELEETLYNKWIDIFKNKITIKYGNVYDNSKIQKLAQENARYLVTVFMPTQMIYTTSLRQINYIVSFMKKFIKEADLTKKFNEKLIKSMQLFIVELKKLNVLEDGLLKNEKNRMLSLFGKNLNSKKDIFKDVYSTTYKGSFAQLAQAQRHRTIDYQIELMDKLEYFIPPIIEDDKLLVKEWLNDMEKVKDVIPQGEKIIINEIGKYDDFILKCKERLCTAAQLEIMSQTNKTLLKYEKFLKKSKSPLADDIKQYSYGARCTFKGYKCSSDCGFQEGKTLKRKI
ncbi:MAG: FAD-dependent thymidylate synthase [Bacilli bacterium]